MGWNTRSPKKTKRVNGFREGRSKPRSTTRSSLLKAQHQGDDITDISSAYLGDLSTSANRHARLGGSPRSAQELEFDYPRMGRKKKSNQSQEPPFTSISMISAEKADHSEMFVALDMILDDAKEDTRLEAESGTAKLLAKSELHSIDRSYRKGAVELFNVQRQSPNVAFVDMRIFPISIIGSSKRNVAQSIALRSLRRHLDFYFEARKEANCATKGPKPKFGPADEREKTFEKAVFRRQYDDAISLYASTLKSMKRRHPKEMTDILTRLAILRMLNGNSQEALSFSQKAVAIHRQEKDQMKSATSLVLLGLIFLCRGLLEKALEAWREALQMTISVVGYDHPHVATILNNLGCLHYLLGSFAASLKLFAESMDLNRKFLGSTIGGTDAILMDISFAKGNVALILAKNGDHDVAIGLLEEVLSFQDSIAYERTRGVVQETKRLLMHVSGSGSTGASTAVSSNFFGTERNGTMTLEGIKIEEGSTSVFGNSDGIPLRRSGDKSPLDAVDSTDNFDTILLGPLVQEYTPRQRVRATVLRWFSRTLEDDEKEQLPFVAFQTKARKRSRIAIDLDECSVIDAELFIHGINEQAIDFLEHDEAHEALELFKSALQSHRNKYGDIHHLVGTANHNIGMVHLFSQKYVQALTSFQEAVSIFGAALGVEHPAIADSLMKIGMIFLLQRNPEGARQTFTRVLRVTKKALGDGHICVAKVMNNIGVAHFELGSYADALRWFQDSREIQEKLLHLAKLAGTALKQQRKTIEFALCHSLSNIAFVYCRQMKYVESAKILNEVKRLQRNIGGLGAPKVDCLETNLKYTRGLAEDLQRKKRIEQLEHSQTRLERVLATFVDKVRCI